MRFYIAGQMRLVPDFNRDAFNFADDRLQHLRHETFNPARWDEESGFDLTSRRGDMADIEAQGFDLGKALAHEIGLVLTWADAVCVLPGWENSLGAMAEVAAARAVGKPVAYLEDIDEDGIVMDALDRDTERLFGKTGPELLDETICQEADRLVSTDRQADYGHPLDNWTQTAALWSAIIGHEVTAEQGLLCMIAAKISRETNAPKRDNLVDIAGYAKCVDLVIKERARREADAVDGMCPNCVTPWKCNGPHTLQVYA